LTRGPSLLFELDGPVLERAARDLRYPKWATLCLLRSLGHPVLNACCIFPSGDPETLRNGVHRLCAAVGADRLMLRSDGGVETSAYPRGGSTFPVETLLLRAEHLLALGRAVVLVEPTNRFTNRLSAVLRIDRLAQQDAGSLVVEALGPGFDVSDLTRGGVLPQLRLLASGLSWVHHERPRWNEFQVMTAMCPAAERTRRQLRTMRVTEVLAELGELPHDAPAQATEDWLQSRGYNGLWQSWSPSTAIRELPRWYEDAFVLANSLLRRPWRCLALSFSRLDDGRAVYWDVVDGQRKFGDRPPSKAACRIRGLP
jgi:hypothetical protein